MTRDFSAFIAILVYPWKQAVQTGLNELRNFGLTRVMSIEYFVTMGVLFLFYAIIRFGLWWQLRLPSDPPSQPSDLTKEPIDTRPLAGRLEQVRQDYHPAKPAPQSDFKRPLLVELKREDIARTSFFQRPPPPPEPPPETPDHEHGLSALMV